VLEDYDSKIMSNKTFLIVIAKI